MIITRTTLHYQNLQAVYNDEAPNWHNITRKARQIQMTISRGREEHREVYWNLLGWQDPLDRVEIMVSKP